MTKYLLSFNGDLYQRQTNALRDKIAQIFLQNDFESLTVLFSSERGGTVDGVALYNFLLSTPKPVHFHAVGNVGGMAVPAFCGAAKRTCASIALFSFHAFDWTFEGRPTYSRIKEAEERLSNDIEIARKIVAARTKIPADKLQSLYHPSPTPTIFDPSEAKQNGLVDHILDLNPSGAAQSNTVLWTVNW
jgi:ATP-dependent protease ClpP protease subunit